MGKLEIADPNVSRSSSSHKATCCDNEEYIQRTRSTSSSNNDWFRQLECPDFATCPYVKFIIPSLEKFTIYLSLNITAH